MNHLSFNSFKFDISSLVLANLTHKLNRFYIFEMKFVKLGIMKAKYLEKLFLEPQKK